MSIRVGLAVLCLFAAVGCSSEAEPEPLPPVAAPSASPAGDRSPVPEDARPPTVQGAAAFTRFFFAEVNRAYATRNPAPVEALSAGDCNSCASITSDIARLRDSGATVAGERFRLQFAEAPPLAADGSAIVDFQFDADPYVEIASDGEVLRDQEATVGQDGQAKVVRAGDRWIMSGLRLVEAPA